MTLLTFCLAVFSVSLNALAQICLRKTMLGAGGLPGAGAAVPAWIGYVAQILLSPWFLGGLACYFVSIAVWLAVLSRAEVSAAYPLLSIGYVITAVVGFFFLGENVTPLRVAGIALICAGLVLVARSA